MEKLPGQVIKELAAIGLAKATDCLCLEDGQVKLRPDIGPEPGAAIAAIEKTASGWKVKFYDKLKALELLGTHLGLFGPGSAPVQKENNLLEAIVASTQGVMETGDIQELQQTANLSDDLVEQE